MTAFRVNRRYRAMYGQERFDWAPGQVVDLSPAQAEWANHDSAGVLSPVDDPEPVVEMHDGGQRVDVTEHVTGPLTIVAGESSEQDEPEPDVAAEEPGEAALEQEPAEADDDTDADGATTEPETPAEVPAQPKRRGRPPKAR